MHEVTLIIFNQKPLLSLPANHFVVAYEEITRIVVEFLLFAN